jgi:TetR/AcrR family transcriptional regulator
MPAAPRTVSRDDDAPTRERILDVALKSFAERGFDGTSTRAIAAAAEVNQGLIPYYFGTKEALWKEAVDHAFTALRRGLDTALASDAGNPREQAALLLRQLVRFVARQPEFVRLMHEEGKRDSPRMRWLVDKHVRPLFDGALAISSRARESTALAKIDPIHFHYILVGAATVIFHQAPECKRLTGIDPTDEAVVEAHADALIALLLGDV